MGKMGPKGAQVLFIFIFKKFKLWYPVGTLQVSPERINEGKCIFLKNKMPSPMKV